MPTNSRRLASEGIGDPSDLRSLSLPGASPGSPTGVWFTGNSRPVRLKPGHPWDPSSDWSGGVMGRWSNGVLVAPQRFSFGHHSTTPSLQHSSDFRSRSHSRPASDF